MKKAVIGLLIGIIAGLIANYAYDFLPGVNSFINQTIGITQDEEIIKSIANKRIRLIYYTNPENKIDNIEKLLTRKGASVEALKPLLYVEEHVGKLFYYIDPNANNADIAEMRKAAETVRDIIDDLVETTIEPVPKSNPDIPDIVVWVKWHQ